jgi:dihydroxyacetone kinase-like protein
VDAQLKKRLILAVARQVIEHADELTALDQAIGDGDHGSNMKRGFEAVSADADALAEKPLPDMLKAIGLQLVMKVGGASGPLYGTFLMSLGKAVPPEPSVAELAQAMSEAIDAVKQRGKSDVHQKTMIDVLAPVQAALAKGATADQLKSVADAAAQSTIPMKAIRGRASFLGDRSIGHMDPGGRSSALIVAAVCDAISS